MFYEKRKKPETFVLISQSADQAMRFKNNMWTHLK
jgi:hypothetical protein